MDKVMMNRYITALLVVLTATGIEAQAYQSALKAARGGDVALEELCRQSVFQGKEAEILSLIRAVRDVQDRDECEPAHALRGMETGVDGTDGLLPLRQPSPYAGPEALLSPQLLSSIQIRAPSF